MTSLGDITETILSSSSNVVGDRRKGASYSNSVVSPVKIWALEIPHTRFSGSGLVLLVLLVPAVRKGL